MAINRSLFYDKMRRYTKDYVERNRLLNFEAFESLDSDIDQALDMCMMYFNYEITPQIDTIFSIEDFTDDDILFFLPGAASYLYESEAMHQERNRLNYSSGGISAQVSDRFGQYLQLSQQLRQAFFMRAQNVKKRISYDEGWGGMVSPYSFYFYVR